MTEVSIGGSWWVPQLISTNGLSSWSVKTCQRGSAIPARKKIFTGGSCALDGMEVCVVEYYISIAEWLSVVTKISTKLTLEKAVTTLTWFILLQSGYVIIQMNRQTFIQKCSRCLSGEGFTAVQGNHYWLRQQSLSGHVNSIYVLRTAQTKLCYSLLSVVGLVCLLYTLTHVHCFVHDAHIQSFTKSTNRSHIVNMPCLW